MDSAFWCVAGFIAGAITASVLAEISMRRIDVDIEARRAALDEERVRRVFNRHGSGRAALRASEWEE